MSTAYIPPEPGQDRAIVGHRHTNKSLWTPYDLLVLPAHHCRLPVGEHRRWEHVIL
ncbi:MAG: hypothetical protein AAFR30_06690 [Cyanobacteria bacterium J06628_4]